MDKLNWTLVFIFSIILFYQKCYIKIKNLPCKNCLYQDKFMNCGPTALKMVLTDFDININLSEIERATNFQKKAGVTLLDLFNYTETLGLKPNALRISEDNLKNILLPAIVFIDGSHFVVIDSINTERDCFLRDPIRGRIKTPLLHLCKMWNGEILIFQHQSDFAK